MKYISDKDSSEEFSMRSSENQTSSELKYKAEIGNYFNKSHGANLDKLNAFSKYVSRQTLSLFLAKNEIFKKIINIHGSIIECGVHMGAGLFTWGQLSTIYEPLNHNRKIIGFDTFSGFPSLSAKDFISETDNTATFKKVGGYGFSFYDELIEGVRLFDLNRILGHINKIQLVKGDALETIPHYLHLNPHLVVSMLYLDFDLYEPTKCAIKHFIKRMPKGSIIVFDELNQKEWPGETLAVLDELGIDSVKILRFPFTPSLSYAVLS